MFLPSKVRICEDVTRDGFQSTEEVVSVEDKLFLIESIADAGVQCIEVGAFSKFEAMKKMHNTNEVFKRLNQREAVEYRALVFTADGVEEAADCGCKKIKLNISASSLHHKSGTGLTTAESMKNFEDISNIAEQKGIAVAGSVSLPFYSPFEGEGLIPMSDLRRIIASFTDIGIKEISLSDAAGLGEPTIIYERFTELSKEFPQVSWMLHMHNTHGLGLAGVLAALQANVTKFDASLAGLGGCPYIKGATGNVATEDLVFMLHKMGIETGIDEEKLAAAGEYVEKTVRGKGTDCYVQKLRKCCC